MLLQILLEPVPTLGILPKLEVDGARCGARLARLVSTHSYIFLLHGLF